MFEIWGIPSSYKLGAQKPPFWRFRNVRAILTAYIFGTKPNIHKQSSALQITRGLLHHLETTWTLVHKRLQIGSAFSPTLHCIARLRRRKSANETQLNFAKRWMVGCANNLSQKSWCCHSRKNGHKNFYICSFCRRLRDLMANICWMKRDIDNRQGRWKARRVSYVVRKFHGLWSTNGLKPDRSFYPPSLFCFV